MENATTLDSTMPMQHACIQIHLEIFFTAEAAKSIKSHYIHTLPGLHAVIMKGIILFGIEKSADACSANCNCSKNSTDREYHVGFNR